LEEFESAEALFRSRSDEFRVASFELEIARFEHQQALAALLMVNPTENFESINFEIRSPIDGKVLRVFQESATVVSPGTPLLEVGNPRDLEVIVDVLSTDAVRISKGDEIRLVHWGGDKSLKAKVRIVEPVEEQRVNVLGDFEDIDESATRLGDGYRVEAEIIVWQSQDVLQVPTAALFRFDGRWCVFVIEAGVARQRTIQIDHRNALMAEVVGGLEIGDQVIVYPSDLVNDGVAVEKKVH
jgi:HlyD family secretion protein